MEAKTGLWRWFKTTGLFWALEAFFHAFEWKRSSLKHWNDFANGRLLRSNSTCNLCHSHVPDAGRFCHYCGAERSVNSRTFLSVGLRFESPYFLATISTTTDSYVTQMPIVRADGKFVTCCDPRGSGSQEVRVDLRNSRIYVQVVRGPLELVELQERFVGSPGLGLEIRCRTCGKTLEIRELTSADDGSTVTLYTVAIDGSLCNNDDHDPALWHTASGVWSE